MPRAPALPRKRLHRDGDQLFDLIRLVGRDLRTRAAKEGRERSGRGGAPEIAAQSSNSNRAGPAQPPRARVLLVVIVNVD